MGDHQNLTRPLLALKSLLLRRDWLHAQIQERPLESVAPELAALCEEAERLDERAREALVVLVMLLAHRGKEPWTDGLRRFAAEHGCGGLGRLMRVFPHVGNDDESSPALNRGPQAGPTLGERKFLARRPDRRAFERLLTDPHPQVLRQLLGNPHLTEMDVVSLLSMRPARSTTPQILAEFPNWLVRSKVRMATLFCPATPSYISVPLVALLTRPELAELVDSPSVYVVLRATALERLERHPPLRDSEHHTVQ
ncbi:MAG: hypothetical protein QM784_06135 [Polyangiaceae bacterium]